MVRTPAAPTTAISASRTYGNAGHLGRRIGVSETAADGAAIADLMMGDVRDRSGEERVRRAQLRIF